MPLEKFNYFEDLRPGFDFFLLPNSYKIEIFALNVDLMSTLLIVKFNQIPGFIFTYDL